MEEIDFTALMLRQRHLEFSRDEGQLLPIFERARNTLFELMQELLLGRKVKKIKVKYQLPTLENTFRYLFKSKKLFQARSRVIEILKLLGRRKVGCSNFRNWGWSCKGGSKMRKKSSWMTSEWTSYLSSPNSIRTSFIF